MCSIYVCVTNSPVCLFYEYPRIMPLCEREPTKFRGIISLAVQKSLAASFLCFIEHWFSLLNRSSSLWKELPA